MTESQKRLLAGAKSYFFDSCFAEFDFLAAAGFRRSFEDIGRNCYLVSFAKDGPSDRFTIRVYHEDDDLLWCDLVCVSNDEIRVRFAGQLDLLGVIAPDEKLPEGSVCDVVRARVHELADLLHERWPDFRDRLLSSLKGKEWPNRVAGGD